MDLHINLFNTTTEIHTGSVGGARSRNREEPHKETHMDIKTGTIVLKSGKTVSWAVANDRAKVEKYVEPHRDTHWVVVEQSRTRTLAKLYWRGGVA
jgi:hypothetical protein